jgi:hypothetical protein
MTQETETRTYREALLFCMVSLAQFYNMEDEDDGETCRCSACEGEAYDDGPEAG